MAEAWSRYWKSWQPLMAANLIANLLTSGLMLWMMRLMFGRMMLEPGAMRAIPLERMTSGMMVAWPVAFLLSCFVQGGVIGTVAWVWRDPDTPWTAFWGQAWCNWWRMIKISLLLGFGLFLPAVLILGLVGGIVHLLSLPAFLASLAYVLLAIFGLLPLLSAGAYYAAYAAVADGGGARRALQKGWRTLTVGYADSLAAAVVLVLILIAITLVFAVFDLPVGFLVGVAGASPVVTSLVISILHSILLPSFPMFYMAVRYETNQRAE